MKKLLISAFLFAVIACGMLFAGGSSDRAVELKGTQKAYIIGDDWGPAVTKTVITFDRSVRASSLNKGDFSVIEKKEVLEGDGIAAREVLDVYPCDAQGNRTQGDSKIIAIEMYVDPNTGSPFIYARYPSGSGNSWCSEYSLDVSLNEGSGLQLANGRAVSSLAVEPSIDLKGSGKIVPQVDGVFTIDQKFTASNGDPYNYADYKPAQDNKQNALIIWLHGGGEGTNEGVNGSYTVLLANEVTAFVSDEFQSLFGGAYVLVPQAPTRWTNGFDGVRQYGDKGSRYTDSVFELIEFYVAQNPDIDPNRIMIVGCAFGGYMTMDLAMRHPDYFAAAVPISEGFYDEFIADEQIESLAENMPLWFVYSKSDTTTDHSAASIPTIERLIAAGARDLHVSVFEDVHDTTGRFFADDGSPHEYNGHWAWVYFDNNECFDESGLNAWEWLASKSN